MSNNNHGPLSARQRAEEVLAFRERYAPGNPRFHERWLLLDNGERGSGQKTMDFSADDLAALVADLTALRHELRDCPTCGGSGVMSVLVAVHPPDEREEYAETLCAECGGRGMSCYARLEADLAALRQRHAEAVEAAWRDGFADGVAAVDAYGEQRYTADEEWEAYKERLRLKGGGA